jgi:hypothetical protein
MKKANIVKSANVKPPFVLTNKTAIIVLLVLPVIYFLIFAPSLLTGSKMMYGSDWLLGGYAVRQIPTQELMQYKTMSMWYHYIFGGLPFWADGSSIYTFIRMVVPTHILWTYLFVCGMMIGGIGMYLFLKSLEISNYAALIGAVAYMFAGNLASTTYAGHEGKILAAAFFPLAFFFWNKGIITHKFHWFVFTGAITGISFLYGHFQLTYYGIWVALAYFVVALFLQRKENKLPETLKLCGYALISMVITFGIIAVNYIPILANLAYGARGEIRGYEFATSWALPLKELFDIIVPQFSGLLDNYWGENYFKLHTEYFGIVLILLAGLALFIRLKERKTLFFFITSIICTLISLGGRTPFYKLIYYLLPGVKRFRGPSMVFYLVAFSTIVIGSIGIQKLIDFSQQKKIFDQKVRKRFKQFVYFIIVLIALIVVVFLTSKSSMTNQQKLDAFTKNSSVFWQGILITIVLIIICLYLFNRLANNKIKLMNFVLLLIPLILFDQWRVDKKFLKTVEQPSVYYAPDEVVNFLKNDTSLYRVHPLYYDRSNDGLLDLYHIQNAGGYCANPLQTYQDFIGASGTVMYNAPNLNFSNFLNLLNAKYIISVPLPDDISRYDARTQSAIIELRNFVNQPGLEIAYTGRKNWIYKNNNVLPRAFIVPKYEMIKGKDQIIQRLKDFNFHPAQYVILSETIPGVISSSSDSIIGSAKIINYTPNRVTIETEQKNGGFLVLSENFHPNWHCKVDGKLTKIYPAYHTFRTVYLSAGNHKVEFYYYSKIYNVGLLINIITSLFCIGVVLVVLYKNKRKKQ